MQIYPYQQACLDAIESARQAGKKKALVVMATGLGKTVVSAIQLKRMLAEKPGRVLYVTHQKEILRQARHTYEDLLDPEATYGYFHGQEKHLHGVDVLFASFQTMMTHRELFARDEFRYVVVDEAHHVQASTYRPTVEYFQPDLMIGLTATPDRTDQKDIRELMGDPVFDLNLFEAMAAGYLVPIDYRLMTDELQNLEVLETPVGKLSIAELNRTIFVPKRDEEIARIIEEKLSSIANPRTILFCSSIEHAERLAELMPYAQVIHSRLHEDQRKRRMEAFRNGNARMAITVDMFNEGIDIPEANTIVFLRSTASRTVYLQQLGRGLRRSEGKDEVLVLDFVANCERIEMIGHVHGSAIQSGQHELGAGESEVDPSPRSMFTLTVDGSEFDERLVDLIGIVTRARQQYTREELIEQIRRFVSEKGRLPKYKDLQGVPYMASTETFRVMFGSWPKALKAAGYSAASEPRSYTDDELLGQIQRFVCENGRTPSQTDAAGTAYMAAAGVFYRRFGSWRNALHKAGYNVEFKTARGHTRELLIEQIQRFVREEGHTPRTAELRKFSYMAGPTAFRKEFGSFSEALKQAGFDQNQKKRSSYTKSDLLDQIRRFVAENNRPPTVQDVHRASYMASYAMFLRLYGSLTHAIEEAGFTPVNDTRRQEWSRDELIGQIKRFFNENGRVPTSREVGEAEYGASREVFRRVFGSWSAAVIEAGFKPVRSLK